jgi:hypothetical protein
MKLMAGSAQIGRWRRASPWYMDVPYDFQLFGKEYENMIRLERREGQWELWLGKAITGKRPGRR